jgi:hypothetical protein
MRLPDQTPPIQRAHDQMRVRKATTAQTTVFQASLQAPNSGVNPSGYENCYKLQGLAQQLCLQYS